MRTKTHMPKFMMSAVAVLAPFVAFADDITDHTENDHAYEPVLVDEEVIVHDTDSISIAEMPVINTIYAHPYSMTYNNPDWHRLWINTSVLGGAFVGSLLVLECLPEDATAWNRAEIQKVPMFKRWYRNVFKLGPEWDHDKFVFDYMLHPYAGAAYFMSARSCGFNFYRSLLYSACVSSIGWEFGIEAFMERPSYQDLFITPVIGSIIGEGFYRAKRHIVDNGYELLGSRFLGGFVAWLVDPVNECIGLFAGNPARQLAGQYRQARATVQVNVTPMLTSHYTGFALSATF